APLFFSLGGLLVFFLGTSSSPAPGRVPGHQYVKGPVIAGVKGPEAGWPKVICGHMFGQADRHRTAADRLGG
ncbi:hypothetical protein ACFCZ4_07790, partial [Streptomyces microflavus]|uniref:hypothetical protein n=1 Tax=Streptomyces microflavus TaxID=1919 RepID=UPI0035D8AB54